MRTHIGEDIYWDDKEKLFVTVNDDGTIRGRTMGKYLLPPYMEAHSKLTPTTLKMIEFYKGVSDGIDNSESRAK